MTNSPPVDCREAFEKWAKHHFIGNHWDLNRCLKEDAAIYGKYLWVHVEDAWQAFSAGSNAAMGGHSVPEMVPTQSMKICTCFDCKTLRGEKL